MQLAARSLLALLVWCVASAAYAQSISSCTPATTYTHGLSVTCATSGMGAKPTAAPVKYDDFQTVTANAEIVTSTAPGEAWSNNGGLGGQTFNPIASTANLRAGTPFAVNMRSQWQPSNDASSVALISQTFVKGYLDGWIYYDRSSVTSPEPFNIKLFRFHPPTAGSSNNIYSSNAGVTQSDAIACANDGAANIDENRFFSSAVGSGGGTQFPSYHANNFFDQWAHIQFFFDNGSGNGTLDGLCVVYVNGARRFDHRGISTTEAGRTAFQEIYVGNYVGTGAWGGTFRAYWESVYIDNSHCRIEIGDNITYASAVHREIQRPTAWAADGTSFTFTLNRGSFGASDAVYIYGGGCSNPTTMSTGVAVTLGSGSGGGGGVSRIRFKVASLHMLATPFALVLLIGVRKMRVH